MQPFNRDLVDPSVSTQELELALGDPATTFPLVDVQDLVDTANAAAMRTLIAQTPATPPQMIQNFRHMRDNHVFIGGPGLCLYDVRHFGWEIAALWPTAKDAGQHGGPVHRFRHFDEAPRGMSIIFVNNHVWHITVSLGGGLNNTSDYHELGYNGVATIANTAEWCGATDWFGIEVVNGVDCYPNPPTKPAPLAPWTKEQRLHVLRQEQHDARDEGHARKAKRFDQWADRLAAQLEAAS